MKNRKKTDKKQTDQIINRYHTGRPTHFIRGSSEIQSQCRKEAQKIIAQTTMVGYGEIQKAQISFCSSLIVCYLHCQVLSCE